MRIVGAIIAALFCACSLAQNTVVIDTTYYANKQVEASTRLDTVGLNSFWQAFQEMVREDRRSKVLKMLDFPIRGVRVAEWNFSVTCDTAYFVHQEQENLDADFTAENAMSRYDLLFTPELKAMIDRTDITQIISGKEAVNGSNGVTYRFFAKDYGFGCGSDFNLQVYFQRSNTGWRLSIASI